MPLDARAALNLAPVQAIRDQATLEVDKLRADQTYGVYLDGRLRGRYLGSELAAGIDWMTGRMEIHCTERVLNLALLKYQYRWAAWRAPGTGLAELPEEVTNTAAMARD